MEMFKETYGLRCGDCGELWDGHQVPCPIEVALRNLDSNRACIRCGSTNIFSVMPWRYEELKRKAAERKTAPPSTPNSET